MKTVRVTNLYYVYFVFDYYISQFSRSSNTTCAFSGSSPKNENSHRRNSVSVLLPLLTTSVELDENSISMDPENLEIRYDSSECRAVSSLSNCSNEVLLPDLPD